MSTQTRIGEGRSRQWRHGRRRFALTLIELVVSAMLTAIMMAVLTNILWSTTRQTRAISQTETAVASPKILVDRLRRDLINARGYVATPSQITLAGFVGPGQTPGVISYTVETVAGRRCLRRNGALVWVDLGSISLTPLSIRDSDDSTTPLDGSGGLPEVPSLFQITVSHADGRVLWNERLDHHGA